MEEIRIEYYDENGEFISEVHYVSAEVKEFVETIILDMQDMEAQVDYWKRLFNVHVTSGVGVN